MGLMSTTRGVGTPARNRRRDDDRSKRMTEQHSSAAHPRGREKGVEPRDIAIDVVGAIGERLA